jgi:hypothetical protein
MKVRIQNEDGLSYNTKITDIETGKNLEYIGHFELSGDAGSGPLKVRLTQYWVAVDVIADAEIKQVCPCCGRSVEEKP